MARHTFEPDSVKTRQLVSKAAFLIQFGENSASSKNHLLDPKCFVCKKIYYLSVHTV